MDTQVQVEIAKRVDGWRKAQGWSKSEFARRMGIYPQSVNKYIAGELDPQNLFIKLAKEGCDLNWLCHGQHDIEPLIFTEEQSKMLLFLQNLGIITMKDLKRFYKQDMSIEEFMRHYQFMKEKIRQEMDKTSDKD